MTNKEKLQEAVISALQGKLVESNNKNYTDICVYGDVPSIEGLFIKWHGDSKDKLKTFLSKFFPDFVVSQLLNFDNNKETEIIEPLNSNDCSCSCEFAFSGGKSLTIEGKYRRPAPQSDEPKTQEEAIAKVKDRFETVYKEIKTPDYVEIQGEIGGDVETYRVFKDGTIGAK